MTLPGYEGVLAAIVAEAEARYPDEACGLVFGRARVAEAQVAIANVYDRYHARDPARWPRTARTAYLMDPLAQLRAIEEAERAGRELLAVWHSHCDAGAYFSAEDLRMAIADGAPILPGTDYVVISVRSGRADEARAFCWNGSTYA